MYSCIGFLEMRKQSTTKQFRKLKCAKNKSIGKN